MISLLRTTAPPHDDRGDGQPVLFLHPFPFDRTIWAPQLDALMHQFRCIAPDLRGFGENPPVGPCSMDQHADDAVALLDALGIEQVVVAGLSMGGYVALALWRRHAHRVRALVLADTRADADSDDARARRQEVVALARERGMSTVADRQIPGLLGKSTRARRPEMETLVRRMIERTTVDGVVGALAAMMERPDSTATLATITVPTLVIVGDEDALTPPREARVMHERIAGSRLEVIAGAGHLTNIEKPAAFNHLLSEFVDGLSSATN